MAALTLQALRHNPKMTAWSLFALAVISKLVFLYAFVASPQLLFYDPDSEGYYNLAVNLVDRGIFSRSGEPPLLPDNTRTPLYPFFLAGLFVVFGKSLAAVAVAQIVISGATVALVYLLGRRLYGHHAAVVGAVLFGIDLSGIVYAHALLTETLFTFFLFAAVVVLAGALRRLDGRLVAGAGLLAGLASLTRPVAFYFFLPAIFLLLLSAGRHWRRGLVASTIFVAAFAITLAPWFVRNYRVFGVANFSGIQGVNMLLINAAYLEADRLGLSVEEVEPALEREAEEIAARLGLNDAQRFQVYQSLGLRKIFAHPIRYAWVHLKGILPALLDNNVRDLSYFRGGERTFFGARDLLIAGGPLAALRRVLASEHRGPLLLFALTTLFQLLVYALALGGAVILWRQGLRLEAGLLVVTIAYLLVMTAPAGSVRFRFPAMPYIDLLAGLGVVAGGRFWLGRDSRVAL
jgi:4-amino-4-deoxy-L-arabinose transferase-like glycosyltransferase